MEIRSLSPRSQQGEGEGEGEGNELIYFVTALTARLREKRDYEVVQAWMSVFLRVHGDEILGGMDGGGSGGYGGDGGGWGRIDGNGGGQMDDSRDNRGEGNKLRAALAEWKEVAEREGKRLGELLGYCGGVIGFLRAPR